MRDALLQHFVNHQAEREADPDGYELRQRIASPDFAAALLDRKEALLADPEWRRRHALLARGPGAAREQPVQNKTMTIGTKKSNAPVVKP